jgi:hypothetical protein
LIFRDESDGDPLQIYMAHFDALQGGGAQLEEQEPVESLSIEDKLKRLTAVPSKSTQRRPSLLTPKKALLLLIRPLVRASSRLRRIFRSRRFLAFA